MNRSRVFALLASVALVSPLVLGAGPALAAGADDQSRESVLVSGTGEVYGRPDTLTADFGVEATATTVGQAVTSANVAAGRMDDALLHAGVAKADLQTSNFNVGTTVNDQQVITGYTVTEGLTAKIRNLRSAGDVMSAAIAAGGDAARLNGVSFAIENDSALLIQARKNAFADARQKAELYAREAGRPLGRVLQVTDTGSGGGGPVGPFNPVAMNSKFTIEPGRQQLTATVSVEWAFGPLS